MNALGPSFKCIRMAYPCG